MPLKVQSDLPAKEILESENIFVMDEDRAMHQDIRPLQVLILNLMPLKEDTELQILRCLSNSPIQVDVTFMVVSSHTSSHTSKSHLNKFYVTFDDVKKEYFDGMIITGAPVELMDFEEVDYWNELTKIMDWTDTHVTSTMYQCWGCQAALYYFYGIKKQLLPKKLFGLYWHKVNKRKIPLVRGFDDIFLAPHSRYTGVDPEDLKKHDAICVLADSDEAGFFLGMADNGRRVFVQGHPEYDRLTLDREYRRDHERGLDTDLPVRYYPENDQTEKPLLLWRSLSFNLYNNWLNYYVYQVTPYHLYGAPDFER